MKTRRGSSYWGNGDEGMIAQFEPGDIVRPAGVNDFIGVVRDVQPRINKVSVAWGAGTVSQHDPDEVQLVPVVSESTKSKMASEGTSVMPRRGTKISADFFAEADEPNQYVGDPRTHGLDKPRGGGFSIMQNLQKDLAPEALAESEKGPIVSPPETDELEIPGEDQNAPDGDMNKAPVASVGRSRGAVLDEDWEKQLKSLMPSQVFNAEIRSLLENAEELARDFAERRDDEGKVDREVVNAYYKAYLEELAKQAKNESKKKVASGELRSRRAMYWMDKDRTYRLTKNEQGAGGAICPKCKKEMAKERFTRSEKLYNCPGCGFKVPSSKVLTKRRVEIEVEPDGNIEIEIEPASSRRGSCR